MSRYRDFDLLHPVAWHQFERLRISVEPLGLLPFESYRSPVDQLRLFKTGASKARPYQSAHQVGLAVDFVPFVDGKWVWPPAHDPIWASLRQAAEAVGLLNTIEWDRPHVEHARWASVRRHLVPRPKVED